MIPVAIPQYEGLMLRRVVLTCGREIDAPDPNVSAPSVRIRLFVCNGSRKDLLGEFNTARHRLDENGAFSLTGPKDLDRLFTVGETLDIEANRYGYGAPSLRGFTVWPDWTFRGQ